MDVNIDSIVDGNNVSFADVSIDGEVLAANDVLAADVSIAGDVLAADDTGEKDKTDHSKTVQDEDDRVDHNRNVDVSPIIRPVKKAKNPTTPKRSTKRTRPTSQREKVSKCVNLLGIGNCSSILLNFFLSRKKRPKNPNWMHTTR